MHSPTNRLEERYKKSLVLLEQAHECIPGQAQTFSKCWTQYPLGASPVFAVRADGGHVWDADGNKLIDWPMALGPLLLGHNHPHVNTVIQDRLRDGIAFSLPTDEELSLAKRLVEWFPYAEGVRFGKNGSDATSGAVRAARAFTGRDKILCCGYHGWQDWFIGTTTRSAGVPEAIRSLTIPFPYNDADALEELLIRHSGEVAAIIIEPMGIVEPVDGYLESIRMLSQQHEAVLIFDECWTGFRIDLLGAFGRFGVAPDIACFGKALGNGAPISAIVGRSDIMEVFEEAFFSFTFGGDMIGIAAANAVLDVLESEPVLEHVERIGRSLMDGFREAVKRYNMSDHIDIEGYPARHVMNFTGDGHEGLLLKSVFQQEGCAAGVLAAGWHAPSFAHTDDDVVKTLAAYDSALSIMSEGAAKGTLGDFLQGRMVEPVFRKP